MHVITGYNALLGLLLNVSVKHGMAAFYSTDTLLILWQKRRKNGWKEQWMYVDEEEEGLEK